WPLMVRSVAQRRVSTTRPDRGRPSFETGKAQPSLRRLRKLACMRPPQDEVVLGKSHMRSPRPTGFFPFRQELLRRNEAERAEQSNALGRCSSQAWSPEFQAACCRAVCVEKPDRAIGAVAKVLVAFMISSSGPRRCRV